jgi:pyruvate formate lyase activating enzyme
MSDVAPYLANWWHALPDGRLQCDLCPRECKLNEGQRGLCFVRERRGNQIILDTWGRSSGFCLDPIEKKPLNHFYPGSSILSFGTAGCNLACKFCQNWDISKSRDTDKIGQRVSPAQIAAGCLELKTPAIAFTYNDPVIFAEYAMDVADACHASGIRTVAVTAGYIHTAPRKALFAKMDAANVDLKAFTQSFYASTCSGDLQTVLDTLIYIKHRTNCWLEITTLLIPGANDSDAEVTALAQWVMRELGPDVPLHFSAFHPDYKMLDRPATPPETLIRARRIAMDQGLRYVYTGNIHDSEGGATYCPSCQHSVIRRDWYHISDYALIHGNQCPHCSHPIAGHFESPSFDAQSGEFVQFGRQRIPVQFNS